MMTSTERRRAAQSRAERGRFVLNFDEPPGLIVWNAETLEPTGDQSVVEQAGAHTTPRGLTHL